jgi:hypothetical protein
VAVTSLVVQTLGIVEQLVPINVTVKNEGSYAEDVTLTVYNETTVIDTVLFSLAPRYALLDRLPKRRDMVHRRTARGWFRI